MPCFLVDENNKMIEDSTKYLPPWLPCYLLLPFWKESSWSPLCFGSTDAIPQAASETFLQLPSFSVLGWHFCTSDSYNYILALTFSSYPWLSLHLTSIDIILISLMLIILYLTHWGIFLPCIQKPTSCFLACVFFFYWDKVLPPSPLNVLTKFVSLEDLIL